MPVFDLYGPRVHAITALCTGAYRLSKRTTQHLLADLFGVTMSLGTVSTLEAATGAAVMAPVAEARAFVQQQGVVRHLLAGQRAIDVGGVPAARRR